MNRSLILICFAVLSISTAAQTNSGVSVAEPQFYNSFYALNADAKLTELDHQKVTTFHTKTRPLPGYASVKVSAEFKPAHSDIRLTGNAQFVVKGRLAVDPTTVYELRLLKVAKDHREILMTQAHGTILGASSTSKFDEGVLPVRFEEYRANSYRITPEQPLAQGEYALSVRGNVMDLYCFGVNKRLPLLRFSTCLINSSTSNGGLL